MNHKPNIPKANQAMVSSKLRNSNDLVQSITSPQMLQKQFRSQGYQSRYKS